VAIDAIVRLQQPAAKPRFEAMQRIARDRLLDLRQQDIVVTHNEIANGSALAGRGMKVGRGEPPRSAGQLDDGSGEGRPRAQTGACADDALASGGGGSTVPPLCITATSETMPVCGK